jgi:hypothetical protein
MSEQRIAKPSAFNLDKFKTKNATAASSVETLQTGLSILKISGAKDFVRLHPDEAEYWSPELCFVSVPIKGQKEETLHLIEEELALNYLPSGQVERFRLALATKPFDAFFFCRVPTQNMDNEWNNSAALACEQAKTMWVQATSRKGEGVEGYQVRLARNADAFPAPRWPTQSLGELLGVTFNGRMIDNENHPALLRLIGAKQELG